MRIAFLSLFILIQSSLYAQDLFETLSFSQALTKAGTEGKFLFLQFSQPDCADCDPAADKAFQDPALSKEINIRFVALRVDPSNHDNDMLRAHYHMESRGGTLIVAPDQTLLYSFNRFTTRPSEYLEMIDKALLEIGEKLGLAALDKEYAKNNRAPGFMEMYIEKKRALHQPYDTLLDEYVHSLPADSLRSIRTLGFIASAAPVLGSAADTALRINTYLFNRTWYPMNLNQRVAINSSIIYKSRQKAIAEKNEDFAKKVALFAQSTFMNNYKAARRVYDYNLLEYYRGVRDSSKVLPAAISYYDGYVMSVALDSILRNDSISRAKMFASAPVKDTMMNGKKVQSRTISFFPSAQVYARELTEGATTLLDYSKEKRDLQKALDWNTRALQFYENASSWDVQAKILYQLGRKDEAVKAARNAIEQNKKLGISGARFEATLKKVSN